jgi:hypothetical protein
MTPNGRNTLLKNSVLPENGQNSLFELKRDKDKKK